VTEEALQALIDLAQSHYNDDTEPLYLSKAGQKLGEHRKVLVAEFGSLWAAVKHVGPEVLDVVVQDGHADRAILITPRVREAIEARIAEGRPIGTARGASFRKLPFPLQVAFCLNTEAGERVAVRTSPPVRYQKLTASEEPPAGYRLIDGKYRLPGFKLDAAGQADLERLWNNYVEWAEANKIDPERLTKAPTTTNALERLLAVQEPDIVTRIVLPADIAAILLRHS
jgi:hypothetical protein